MMRYDESASGNEIEVRSGEEFEIALPETATAGYRWTVAKPGPACSLENETTAPAGKVGGSGTHLWRFRATVAGNCEIRLEYGRAWESEPARTFTLRVRVRS